jgi:hypothetical protein
MAAMRLNRVMLAEVAFNTLCTRERSVFLCRTEQFADRIAFRFRKILHEENFAQKWVTDPKALEWAENPQTGGLCKPPGSNPSFVQLYNGGWVFFHDINDLDAGDDVGHANFVYWPSEGGNYEKVTYEFWRSERSRSADPYRLVLTAESQSKTQKQGPRTAWDIILEDEDDA